MKYNTLDERLHAALVFFRTYIDGKDNWNHVAFKAAFPVFLELVEKKLRGSTDPLTQEELHRAGQEIFKNDDNS